MRASSLTRQQSPRSSAAWLSAAVIGAVALGGAIWLWPSQQAAIPAAEEVAQAVSAGPALPTKAASADAARLTPYDKILSNRSDDWQVMRLAENPKILVIEFPNLAAQGEALNRLAALIEKNKAPRDRVLSDDGLAKFIKQVGDTPETFYLGHDYPAEAVARFFTLAVDQQLMLNAAELRIGNVLLEAGLLREESDRLIANPDRQAVVSFTALQADDPNTPANETVDARHRETILMHELSHGEFFTNAAYRDHCWKFWQSLTDADRQHLRKFLTAQGYDPRNEDLMVNETQAFLMHTPDPRAFGAEQLGVSSARLDELRAKFKQGAPASIFLTIGR